MKRRRGVELRGMKERAVIIISKCLRVKSGTDGEENQARRSSGQASESKLVDDLVEDQGDLVQSLYIFLYINDKRHSQTSCLGAKKGSE